MKYARIAADVHAAALDANHAVTKGRPTNLN